jgi:hypothetical protein
MFFENLIKSVEFFLEGTCPVSKNGPDWIPACRSGGAGVHDLSMSLWADTEPAINCADIEHQGVFNQFFKSMSCRRIQNPLATSLKPPQYSDCLSPSITVLSGSLTLIFLVLLAPS